MTRIFGPLFFCTICLGACHTKIQQVQPPRIADDAAGDADMMAEPEAGPAPIIKSKDEKRAECCGQCLTALNNDRSGQKASEIPCVDFTADMKEECVVWFRSNAVQASDAAACVEKVKASGAAKAKSDS